MKDKPLSKPHKVHVIRILKNNMFVRILLIISEMSEQNCCIHKYAEKYQVEDLVKFCLDHCIWCPLKMLFRFCQNFLFDLQKEVFDLVSIIFFYKHKDYFTSLEEHGQNTHLCTLDVERNNNVKFSEILVSFPNEKRINGKQNYFYLSYLCHRKKPIHIISN